MKKEKKEIIIDGKTLHIIISSNEDIEKWYNDFNLWEFPLEELLDGTIEINEDIWYLYYNGRVYETHNYI